MKELKIRGLISNIITILVSLLSLGLLALPMLIDNPSYGIYTGYESIFNIKNVSEVLGTDGKFYIASSVFMLIFMLLTIALVVLSIISLIGIKIGKIKLSMSFSMRIISIIASVMALIATIFLICYFNVNNYTGTRFGYATIIPFVLSLLCVASSFVSPTIKAYTNAAKLVKIDLD